MNEISSTSLNVEPLLSLPAVVIGFILVLLAGRLIAEYVVHKQDRQRKQGEQSNQQQTASGAVERYHMDRGA